MVNYTNDDSLEWFWAILASAECLTVGIWTL